jgi:Zn-dependent protease with chaperone function
MENPCLTFVTPTLLAGDRSLAAVVAHEIAHRYVRSYDHLATELFIYDAIFIYIDSISFSENSFVTQLDRKLGHQCDMV